MTSERNAQTILEPVTHEFIWSLTRSGALPYSTRSPAELRRALMDLQQGPVGRPRSRIEDLQLPVGPRGTVGIRIIRPWNGGGILPTVLFFHGGGWVGGDADTHDRLAREIATLARAAVVLVLFGCAPEAPFPVPIEEAYAATGYIGSHAAQLGLDGSRVSVMGDGTGGAIAATVTILAKLRGGPRIASQVLLYPVISAELGTASQQTWHEGLWLTNRDLTWLWDIYLPNREMRTEYTAAPLYATIDQLHGLPETLLITAEADVLRDTGEAYARKLSTARVRTTCTRYNGTVHDFLMLNALADTPATRAAINQAADALRSALA